MDRIIIEHWIGLALALLWTTPDPEVAEVRAADGLADARLRLERAEDLDGADADAIEARIGALEAGLESGALARDVGVIDHLFKYAVGQPRGPARDMVQGVVVMFRGREFSVVGCRAGEGGRGEPYFIASTTADDGTDMVEERGEGPSVEAAIEAALESARKTEAIT